MNFLLKIKTNLKSEIVFLRRYNSTDTVRVRFAPSPTGHLHLGGLRTALYNYFFAKSHNGKFLLRIEDTDRTRLVNGATEKILQDFEWVGLKIDEGPYIGGSYGPYFQSERLEIYRNEVKKLLENGTAYYCFCSERRLELLRKEAIRARQIPKYDNKCRLLTPLEIAEKMTNSQKYCIRFKLENYKEPTRDIVYGDVYHNVSENEGDPIIMKTDGFPTYHFANVVDDHLMQITHVFRGVEWQISTTKHLLMYKVSMEFIFGESPGQDNAAMLFSGKYGTMIKWKFLTKGNRSSNWNKKLFISIGAFNWKAPQYGHLPLLVNADGTKLSKRQGDIQISSYKEKGIFPQALVNYVTQAGGGFPHEPQAKPKIHTFPELISKFDISKVNSHPSRLNPDLLNEFNRLEIMRKTSNAKECEELIDLVRKLVIKSHENKRGFLNVDGDHIKKVLEWASHRLTSLNELVSGQFSFLWIVPQVNGSTTLNRAVLNELLITLETKEFIKTELQTLLKDFSKQKSLMYGSFMKTLRSLLSGADEGPGVAEMMEILGKETTMRRIRNALSK